MAMPQYYNQMVTQQQFQPSIQNQVPLAQMPVAKTQQTYLLGKYIQKEEEILASEIPMDGNMSYFPSVDENYIFVKRWDATGKIVTKKYVLSQSNDISADTSSDIQKTLNSMKSKLDRLESILTRKPNKKEGDADVQHPANGS